MSDIKRYDTTTRRSRYVVFNRVVYVGGQTASTRAAPIEQQTEEILAKIDELLADAGTSKERLLTTQIFLADITRDFAGMNKVWDAWTPPGATSTRATVQAPLAHPDIHVEMVVTAALP